MNDSCHVQPCHNTKKRRFDWLLWGSGGLVAAGYLLHVFAVSLPGPLTLYADSSYHLMNRMWWGLALGILFVGLLSHVPREFVLSLLGRGGTISGILRATLAGTLLDLCSHGILLVGMKLYERGASIGQVMAFLIASPWNSLSLTIILISLTGWQWTLLLIAISAGIAIISGLAFDMLAARGILPANPHRMEAGGDFSLRRELGHALRHFRISPSFLFSALCGGMKESRMILRWILLGVVLASLLRAFVSPEDFAAAFGPTLGGLGLTLLAATMMEICSEGSTPIAADILNRAHAPGNAFAFLMAGVSTDYTEIMALREGTRSWKIALFLPLITLPQIVFVAWLMNRLGG